MSDDQVGCEWVSVSSGTGLPGLSRTKAVKRLCVCESDQDSNPEYIDCNLVALRIVLSRHI